MFSWNGLVTWILIITTAFIFYLLYINRKFKYWKNRNVPTPASGIWTFLSNLYRSVEKPAHKHQTDLYKKYGRIYGGYIGTEPVLNIAEPSLIKNILVKDFNAFQSRTTVKTGKPTIDKLLSVVEGEDWKRIRCIMSPTFSSSRMRKLAYLVKECAEKFAKYFEKLAEDHGTIDCKRYLNNFSIDVIASTAFGTKLDSLDDPNNEFATKARKIQSKDATIGAIMSNLIPISQQFFLSLLFSETFEYFQKFALHVIKQREQNKERANDFLQLMLDAQRGVLENTQEDKYSIEELPKHKTMSMEEMLAQCNIFLLAGNDTTSLTVAFFLHYMSLNVDCQEKIIKEIDEVWEKHEDINFDVLNKMLYLDATLCEVLRVKPIAHRLARKCSTDYELGDTGIKIPKGMNISVPVYAMHHDPEFFPDPEVFDPERFMPENRSSVPDYAYLPFGDGPRNCIGMRFAMMVMKMCIVHLFKNVHVSKRDETEAQKPLKYYHGQQFNLHPKEVVITLEKRKH